jgi:hypothetical protein
MKNCSTRQYGVDETKKKKGEKNKIWSRKRNGKTGVSYVKERKKRAPEK